MSRYRKITLLFLFVLLLIALIVGWRVYKNWPSKSPEAAINKYVLVNGSLFESYDLRIRKTNMIDPNYGFQYLVEGFYAQPGNVEVRFFYLKQKNDEWYVFCAGTGP